jgi:putative CocE/NonD family hydrolase
MHLITPMTTDVICERDLPVTMDDGAVLYADRWVARASADSAQPTVLVRSPYGRRHVPGLLYGRVLAERGFQVVVQSVRGTFGSEGRFEPFDERADGAATLRWLETRRWHAGKVATMGPSYLGLVQWALAADAGDELAAMAIQVSASQFYDQTYAGGSIALETVATWLVIIALQERRLGMVEIGRALRTLKSLMDDSPLIDLDVLTTGAPVAWLREGFESPGRDDDYWTRRDYSRTVPQITAPVSFVGGWYDFLLPWMLDDFVALQDAGREPRLLIGPWVHTSSTLAAVGERDGIAWLRAHLLGDDRLVGREKRPQPVRLRVTGVAGGWRDFPRWPPPQARDVTLHLHADGGLSRVDSPAVSDADAGVDRYRYDPADPTPSYGGPVLMDTHPVVDNGPLEARDDVLVYTSEELAVPIEVIGRPAAEIHLRTSLPYFDVFVRVCEVDARGVSRNVCDGFSSVSPARNEPEADGSWKVTVELWPVAHRFASGHRLRVLVASGAHPRFARNPGTGEDASSAAPESMRAVELALLRDAGHPSSVSLPTMPVGDAAAAPAAGSAVRRSRPRVALDVVRRRTSGGARSRGPAGSPAARG